MMRKILLGLGAALLLLSVIGCSFEIPQKVTVKTKASYNFSVGDVDKDLSSMIDIKGSLGSNLGDGIELYDYYPDGQDSNVQQYLLSTKVAEIPLDISSYLGSSSSGLFSFLGDFGFEKTFNVPVAFNKEESQSLDLSSIQTAINTGVTFAGVITNDEIPISLGSESAGITFDYISYVSGELVITADVPDGTEVTVYFASTTYQTAVFSNGSATISLNGKTVRASGMKLKFTYGVGTTYVGQVSEDSVINVASNLTVDKSNPLAPAITVNIDDITIENSDNGLYESCTIGEGNLSVKMDVDSSWSKVVLLLKLNTTGGLEIADDSLSDASSTAKVIDLKDRTIKPQNIIAKPEVDVELTNSTINFQLAPVVKISADIQDFASVTVKVGETDNLNIDKTIKLSETVTNYIKEIDFDKCGIEITYLNTLPGGNDITLESTCDFFNLDTPATTAIQAGTTDEATEKIVENENYNVLIGTGAGEFSQIHFTSKVSLPGESAENPGYITLTDVNPGAEYKIKLSVSLITDWNKIKIRKVSQSSSLSLGMNIASMLSSLNSNEVIGDLMSNISIPSIPVYLYVNGPLDNVKFSGSLKVGYGKEDPSTSNITINEAYPTLKIVDPDDSTKNSMKFVPDLDLELSSGEDDSLKTTEVNLEYSEYSASEDFCTLLEAADVPEEYSLAISYDLALTDGDSTSDYLTFENPEKSGTSLDDTSVVIKAMIVLPLQLQTTAAVNLDLLEMAGVDESGDLFGRTEATDVSDYEQFISVIKSAGINYDFSNMPIYCSEDLGLDMDLGAGSEHYSFKSGFIGVEKATIQTMLESDSFMPKVEFNLPEGTTFSIPRDMSVKVHLSLSIDTDGSVSFPISSGSSRHVY